MKYLIKEIAYDDLEQEDINWYVFDSIEEVEKFYLVWSHNNLEVFQIENIKKLTPKKTVKFVFE